MDNESRVLTSFYIAGFQFYEGPLVLDKLRLGDILELQYDEKNRIDTNAVQIGFKDEMIGWIPNDQNAEIALFLKWGHADVFEAEVIEVNKDKPTWKQVKVRIRIKDKRKKA